MKTTAKYFLLFIPFFIQIQLSAQSLYQDAIILADAIEKQQLWLVVESDTTSIIEFEKSEEEIEPIAQLIPPRDSILITKQGVFTVKSNGKPFDLTVRYDTVLTVLHSESETCKIKNNNLFVFIENTETGFNTEFQKPSMLQIYTILSVHADNDVLHTTAVNYQALDNYQVYQDNPYLGRLLEEDWFAKEDWMGNYLFSTLVNTQIQARKAAYTPMFQKLYADSLNYQSQLLTIQGIQTEYEEPAFDSVDELLATAEILEANTPESSLGFSTTTLIAGLSDFITERAQEEFNITFMERFRERLNDSEHAELHVLFPKSRDFLNQIDITNYKSALLSARQVFAEDVQKLSFNLPKIFELPKYNSIQNIPEIYNLLIVYSIIDLIYRDNQMEDILPLTFRKVQAHFQELEKAVNFRLAELDKAAPDRLVLTEKISLHEQSLIQERDNLIDKQVELETNFLFAALSNEADRAMIDKLYFDYHAQVNRINLELENAWDTIRQIPANLEGRLFYDDLMQEPSIDKYDLYFGTEPNPKELISAGLFMSRCMVCGVFGTPNKANLLLEWDELMQRTNARFQYLQDSIQATSDWGIAEKTDGLEAQRITLQEAIVEDISFWKNHAATEHDAMAMTYLSKTLNDSIFEDFQGNSIIENLEIRQDHLHVIKMILLTKLQELESETQQKSPLLQQLEEEGIEEIEPVLAPNPALIQLIDDAKSIRTNLERMDATYAKDLLKARQNAETLSKVLELTAHLFLFLRTDEGDHKTWLDTNEWNTLMQNDLRRDVFFGLLHQRMSKLYPSSSFSNKGLATVTTNFVYNLAKLKQHRELIATKKEINQPLQFEDYFPFVKIAVNLMNGVLETPVLMDSDNEIYSLAERDSALAFIPQISNHTLNLFENVHGQQYNFAIYNTLELYKIISERTLQNCDQKKGKDKDDCYQNEQIRNGILTYGTFISDVALAQEPEDIRRALEVVALPPGSSRLKRQNSYNVSLNSYFGLGAGNEHLTNPTVKENTIKFNSVGLTVPVGISASWKVSPTQKGSFSIFMPIIDIGAVTAFRLNEEPATLPELSFQNILSPGAYLLYNFQKSPFTIGIGSQYGPQVRTVTRDGLEYQTGAWRLMFTATIDVPLFNLFGNRY